MEFSRTMLKCTRIGVTRPAQLSADAPDFVQCIRGMAKILYNHWSLYGRVDNVLI